MSQHSLKERMNARICLTILLFLTPMVTQCFQSGQARGFGTPGGGASDEFLKHPKRGLGQAGKTKKKSRHRRYYGYHDSPMVQKRRKAADVKQETGTTISTMSFDQMRNEKNKCLGSGNFFSARKFLERMIKICDDMAEIADLMIEYGDTLYALEKRPIAEKIYAEFAQLYPGHIRAEYAQYRAVLCASQMVSDAHRDQQATKRAIELADIFLERSTIYTTYRAEVEKIRSKCYQILVDHEFVVCEFYLTQDRFKPLERRLEYVRNELIPEHPKAEVQLAKWEEKVFGCKQEFEELKELPFYTPILRTALNPNEPTKSRRRRHGYYANTRTT